MEQKTNIYSEKYLQYLLEGNRSKCSALAHQFLRENHSINDLYESVFKEALYEVGVLWETNKISVAAEHLATAITEGILNELFEQIISSKRLNKKVVLTCVENERHQVGIKMVADVFEMMGWESYFLGTGIPIYELKRYLREEKPEVLAISISIYFNYKNLIQTLDSVRADFPDLMIVLGGQAFKHIETSALKKLDRIVYFSDLYILEQFVKSISKKNTAMSKDELIRTATKIAQVDEKLAAEYSEKREALVETMNQKMVSRPDIQEMVGENNINMMRDNHANHARFLESIFHEYNPEVLVDTVLWVFRAYRSRNFSSSYWAAQLNAWLEIYKEKLSPACYEAVYPYYNWMQINIPVFNKLAEENIDAPLSSH